MSKCDISIELDHGSVAYRAGGVVRDVVTVEVNAPCICQGLELALGWHTHGRGNRASEEVSVVELFRGKWAFAERVSYPFEVELPTAPLSYHGHFLNVDWFLSARVKIPWAMDSKCE